jgi:hypothetical protein
MAAAVAAIAARDHMLGIFIVMPHSSGDAASWSDPIERGRIQPS